MLSTEREDFETQLEVLFGGYPTFLTPPRKEAYWRGLQKMPLSTFVRCVDYALQDASEEGKKLPTVHRMWDISRALKSRAPSAQRSLEVDSTEQFDHFHTFGQRQFVRFLRRHDVSNDVLPALIKRKNEIIDVARNDPDMQQGDPVELGEQLREILWAGWRQVFRSNANRGCQP